MIVQATMEPAYFLYHSIGQYPEKAGECARAMAEFSTAWGAYDDGQWAYALSVRQKFIDRWRRIVNADPGTLTTCENVTSGLSARIIEGFDDPGLALATPRPQSQRGGSIMATLAGCLG